MNDPETVDVTYVGSHETNVAYVDVLGRCPWCGTWHTGWCPRIYVRTYDQYGRLIIAKLYPNFGGDA